MNPKCKGGRGGKLTRPPSADNEAVLGRVAASRLRCRFALGLGCARLRSLPRTRFGSSHWIDSAAVVLAKGCTMRTLDQD